VDDVVCSLHPSEISPTQAPLPFPCPPSSSTLAVTLPAVLASEQTYVSSTPRHWQAPPRSTVRPAWR
jgi:hypothetical protein